ncbi:MAG: hypothetical protein KAU52_08150 [Methanosarcinales archaeon]|nr:hypothetical protein [Methanosarcinales archaeon]
MICLARSGQHSDLTRARPKAVGIIIDAMKEWGMDVVEPGLQVSGAITGKIKQESRELGESIARALSEKI